MQHLSPREALAAVDRYVGRSEKVHEEFHDLGQNQSGVLVYEQYFSRVGNRIALIVIAENFSGQTRARVISTGSSKRLLFDFDWGAADAYVNEVLGILARADQDRPV